MKPRVAINGFGRIGKMMYRANLERDLVDFVGINDLSEPKDHKVLLEFDSSYGPLNMEVTAGTDFIACNGKKTHFSSEKDPTQLPWKKLKVDVVLEASGVFTDRAGASRHLAAGAKKVIITAPATDDDATIVLGVNDDMLDLKKHTIISNASCTTNCLAPVVKILDEEYTIEYGLMTTVHSYTNDQNILDKAHKKDMRRARAAALSLIPTSTGAAKAIGRVIPHLNGKLNGVAVRAPTPTVSLVDFVAFVKNKPKDAAAVNVAMKKRANGAMKGILAVEDRPLVSIDFKKNPHSSIVDSELTMVQGNLVKVFAWYDNEWGYSMRVIELAARFAA